MGNEILQIAVKLLIFVGSNFVDRGNSMLMNVGGF